MLDIDDVIDDVTAELQRRPSISMFIVHNRFFTFNRVYLMNHSADSYVIYTNITSGYDT